LVEAGCTRGTALARNADAKGNVDGRVAQRGHRWVLKRGDNGINRHPTLSRAKCAVTVEGPFAKLGVQRDGVVVDLEMDIRNSSAGGSSDSNVQTLLPRVWPRRRTVLDRVNDTVCDIQLIVTKLGAALKVRLAGRRRDLQRSGALLDAARRCIVGAGIGRAREEMLGEGEVSRLESLDRSGRAAACGDLGSRAGVEGIREA
jgi:hypothetical protein